MHAPNDPPPPPGATTQAAALLDAVTHPLMLVDRHGRVVAVNAAFTQCSGWTRDTLAQRPWEDVLRATDTSTASGDDACGEDRTGLLHSAHGAPRPVRWSARPAPSPEGGTLFTLTDLTGERQILQQRDHVVAWLNLVQDFGRIGLFERSVDGMQGWWDKHMFRFWGLPASDEAPPVERVRQAVVPEDREASVQAVLGSMHRPGRHGMHYRVQAADGTLRWLHSQWEVLAGESGRAERMLGVVMDDTDAILNSQAADVATAQLRLAVELAGISIWRHDFATQTVHYSPEAWRVLGLPPDSQDMTLDQVRALVHPDDLPQVLASAELALRTQRPVDMRARYRRVDGQWREVMTRRVVQRDAQGKAVAFLGVAMDVTEQAQHLQREQALQQRLELAAAATGVAVWSLDVDTQSVYWNAQMLRLHGLDPQAPAPPIAAYSQRFVHPEQREEFERTYHLLAQGELAQIEHDLRIVRADGSVRFVTTRTHAQHGIHGRQLHGVMVDITERMAAERALRQAHERAALATRGAGVGTWEYDVAADVGWWDEQMWRLRGLEPAGPHAPNAQERLRQLHPDDRASWRREFDAAVSEQRPSRHEFRVLWPDGRVRWLASRSVPLQDEQGHTVRRIGVNWDITDSRDAEQARQAELLAHRESQAKSQFLARMSHELRTPLNAVIGFTQLLQSDDARVDPAMRQRQLDHIRVAGEHLLALINDALDLSSLESGQMRLELVPTALQEEIDATLPLVQEMAQRRGVLISTTSTTLSAQADATRLRQVLLNLLSNAIKYNREGGEVSVDTARDGDWVMIRVTDTGRGFSDEQLAHVFEPFNRLGAEREDVEGTGIGLAIVKATVERMGGQVRVSSQAGAGSRFEVRLHPADGPAPPPVAAHEVSSSRPRPAPGPAPRTPSRLLYIEDNPVNALIVKEIVARRPTVELQVADTGTDGVRLAQQWQPQLILLDMHLPDFDGYEVLRRLRAGAGTHHIPCIALSANAVPEDIDRALRAGFSDYWTKPLDVRAFLSALDTLLG